MDFLFNERIIYLLVHLVWTVQVNERATPDPELYRTLEIYFMFQ